MSDRPTPETDAYCLRPIGFPTGYEWREFARKLERQRDAAIERFQSIQEARATLKRELDEAPETDDLLNTIRKLQCELAEAVKARDYNRTCIKRLTEERENDTQAELAAWELLRDTRELARELRDALVSIEEYWNRDQNETAMADACWHAVNTAQDVITKAKEVLP